MSGASITRAARTSSTSTSTICAERWTRTSSRSSSRPSGEPATPCGSLPNEQEHRAFGAFQTHLLVQLHPRLRPRILRSAPLLGGALRELPPPRRFTARRDAL